MNRQSISKKLYQTFDEKTKASIVESSEFGRNHVVASSPSLNQRNPYWPGTYESARPYDAVPGTFKDVIRFCRSSYLQVGVVRNVFDLMIDFVCEDFKFVHPDKKVEAFFKVWAKKTMLNDAIGEFAKHFLIDNNVVVKRYTAKLNKPAETEWMANAAPDRKIYVDQKSPGSREIPIKYSFVNIMSLDWVSDESTTTTGQKQLIFKVNPMILNKVRDANSSLYQSMYKNSPDIADGIKKSGGYQLDMDKVYVAYSKKDSWDDWAVPFLYSVIADIKFKDKLRQAEIAALDGVINVIRVWKLGDHKEKILPAEGAIDRLIEILETNTGGGAIDIVWDSMIDMKDYYPPVKDILGSEKYQEVDKDILVGLGIPEVLLGGGGANFSNSFIQLKTIIERLKAVRTKITDWLDKEVQLVCKAMDIKIPPKIRFGQMNLEDENTTRKLILNLLDRGIVSVEAVLDMYGEDVAIEIERMKQEKSTFDKSGLEIKGPFMQPPALPGAPTSKKPGVPGRPQNSKDTEPRRRENIKIRTKANVDYLMKGIDIVNGIENVAIPYYMLSLDISNARKLTNEQKEDVDNLRILLLSCIKPSDSIDNDKILATIDNINNANAELFTSIKQEVSDFISKNGYEPNISQKKNLYAIAWANFYSGDSDV